MKLRRGDLDQLAAQLAAAVHERDVAAKAVETAKTARAEGDASDAQAWADAERRIAEAQSEHERLVQAAEQIRRKGRAASREAADAREAEAEREVERAAQRTGEAEKALAAAQAKENAAREGLEELREDLAEIGAPFYDEAEAREAMRRAQRHREFIRSAARQLAAHPDRQHGGRLGAEIEAERQRLSAARRSSPSNEVERIERLRLGG